MEPIKEYWEYILCLQERRDCRKLYYGQWTRPELRNETRRRLSELEQRIVDYELRLK